jgi:hypothetical protein
VDQHVRPAGPRTRVRGLVRTRHEQP